MSYTEEIRYDITDMKERLASTDFSGSEPHVWVVRELVSALDALKTLCLVVDVLRRDVERLKAGR